MIGRTVSQPISSAPHFMHGKEAQVLLRKLSENMLTTFFELLTWLRGIKMLTSKFISRLVDCPCGHYLKSLIW